MKLSFNQKRIGAGILLFAGLLSVANHYFEWGIVGRYSKQVMICVFVLLYLYFRFVGPTLEEIQEYREKQDGKAYTAPGFLSWPFFLALSIVILVPVLTGPVATLRKGESMQRGDWIEFLLIETVLIVVFVWVWRRGRHRTS